MSSEVVGLVALVAESLVDEVVEEDPSLVEEVSRHHEEPCQEEVASMIQVVVALLQGIRDLVGGGQVDLVGGVAFLQVMKLVEEACIHPSYQEEGVQE